MAPRRAPREVAAGPSHTQSPLVDEPIPLPSTEPLAGRARTPSEDEDEGDDSDEQEAQPDPTGAAGSPQDIRRLAEEEVQELEKRREALHLQLRLINLRQEVDDIEAQVAGTQPPSPTVTTHTPLPIRKRHLSNSPSRDREAVQKVMRTIKQPKFSSKSMQQLHEFDGTWQTVFESIEYDITPDWPQRVRTAAVHLEYRARDMWRRDRKANIPPPETWESFILWCKDTIEDADVRKGHALEKLASLKQTASLSTRDLVHEMELLEEEIGILSEDERKGWQLFHALTSPLRDAVRRDLERITSRAQVLASATRLETTVSKDAPAGRTRYSREPRERERESSENTKGRGKPFAQRFPPRFTREPHARTERGSPSPAKRQRHGDSSKSGGECFNCGEKGHWKDTCPKTRPSTFAGTQAKRTSSAAQKEPEGSSKK